jgi:hypothetical protein
MQVALLTEFTTAKREPLAVLLEALQTISYAETTGKNEPVCGCAREGVDMDGSRMPPR